MTRLKNSLPSASVSVRVGTLMVWRVSPGRNWTVASVAVKSVPGVAVSPVAPTV